MYIEKVSEIIGKIADGIEEACMQCLERESGLIVYAITEQLYSGQDGSGNLLSPTYDKDPFFREPGTWFNRAEDYQKWKYSITPPVNAVMLGLAPRPENVPNLYINGLFYSNITATRSGDKIVTNPGDGNGPSIVAKYGDDILNIGPSAIEYFNKNRMWPAISDFFNECGYR